MVNYIFCYDWKFPNRLGFIWGIDIMPSVHRFDGMRVVIYPNDHRPAHVHVISADKEAVFVLNCPDGPPKLRENFGFPGKQLNDIADELDAALKELCARWSDIHDRH